MIRVTVELVPHGFEEMSDTIATAQITNDGTGTLDFGNYNCWFTDPDEGFFDNWYKARVESFPRKEMCVWKLIHLAIAEYIKEKELAEKE